MVEHQVLQFPRQQYQLIFAQTFENLGQSGQNVLVFYGEDGLGKTSLMNLLEQDYRSQAVVLNGAGMRRHNQLTTERSLELLCTQLEQDGIVLQDFYVVYAYYLAWAHLGKSIDPSDRAGRTDVGDIASTLADLINSVAQDLQSQVPFLGTISKLSWMALRFMEDPGRQKAFLQRLNACAEPFQLLDQLPAYLMMTLDQVLADEARQVTILVDGYEELLDRAGKCWWLEEMMAVENPSVLWVVFAKERIVSLPQARHVQLERLTEAESLDWLRSLNITEPEVARTIAIAAHGMPFDLLTRAQNYQRTRQVGARSREDALQQLIEGWNPQVSEMLRILAFARTWDLELLSAIADQKRVENVQSLWSEVLRLPIVESIGTQLWQVHPLMRQSLQQQFSEPEQAAMHQWLYEYARSRYSQRASLELLSDAVYHGLRGNHPEATGSWILGQVSQLQAGFRHLEAIALIQLVAEMGSRLSAELGAIALTQMGVSQTELGQGTDAIATLEQARAVWASVQNPQRAEVATVEFYLARAYFQAGQIFDAQNAAVRSQSLRTALFGAESLPVAEVLSLLGQIAAHRNQEPDAIALTEQALRIYERQSEGSPLELVKLKRAQVALLCRVNQLDAGARLGREALVLAQTELGAEHPEVILAMEQLGSIYEGMGKHKFDQAVELYQRALELGELSLGADHPLVLFVLKDLARICRRMGQMDPAEEFAQRHNANVQIGTFDNTVAAARGMSNLAYSLWQKGEYGKAEPLWVRSLSIYEQQLGARHPDTASSLNNLAGLYESQGRYSEAEPLYVRSIAIAEKALGIDHPHTQIYRQNLESLRQKT
jgi:tetratricopeptide (TPR) repeat protein